jgi:hypothetical protein
MPGEVAGPVAGARMTEDYVRSVGRLAYLWGWPLVNMHNRRDFSIVLEQHGLDLDQALRDVDAQPDYPLADHARDLAGALRWNAVGALRRRSHSPR